MTSGPDAARWEREMALFHAALERAPDDRAAFVADAAGDDPALRAAVHALLAADADASGFLEVSPAAAVRAAAIARGADLHPSWSDVRRDPAPDLLPRLQEAVGPAYRVERELGGGGMSRVFLAEEAHLGRRVVVKVLPPELARGLDVERFRREVRLAATLRHPHVVPLLTAGESANGLVYFTMPYIAGESLRERLARDGPLPPADVVRIVREVADALAYAHRHGVVHRDVKPANVLVDGDHVLVTDFGIAKALSAAGDGAASVGSGVAASEAVTSEAAPSGPVTSDAVRSDALGADALGADALGADAGAGPPTDDAPAAARRAVDSGATLTAHGFVLGTPAYMSPEQARGEPVDGRSDVYSLGCMTFEMLTGVRAEASTTSELREARRDGARPVSAVRPELPPAVDAVLARALAAAPDARFATADAFARALDAALGARPEGPPTGPPDVVGRPTAPGTGTATRRSRRAAPLVGVAAVLALTLAGAGWWASARAPAPVAARPAATASARPSLAVLPFRNLGQPGDEYFADGIAEEVATRLVHVSGLGVIAWTSASRYRGASRPAAEIGRELGADYVLEGTVQWARAADGGSRVRVTPRLVRVADARQLWAGPYEAELADVFAIQAAVAGRVVAALDVALPAPERREVVVRPTRNMAAYDSYLRGNSLTQGGMAYVPQARRDAVQWYERAVALDPTFADAWARLAQAQLILYLTRDDPAPSRRARARAAALRAFALDSTLPDASLALGQTADRRSAAIAYYVAALRAHPNNTALLYALGDQQLSLGHLDAALASFTRAATLDPRSPDGPGEIANVHDNRGEYATAVLVRERQIALDPGSAIAYVAQALSLVNARGDTAAARRTLDRAVTAAGRANLVQMLARRSGVRVARLLWPALDPDVHRALDTLSVPGAQSNPWRVYRLKAEHFDRSGQPRLARRYEDSARVAAIAALRTQPDDPEIHEALGLAYAGLGRAADALREGRRAVALDTGEVTTDNRRWAHLTLAMIAARVGARDVALAELAGPLPESSPPVSAYWLRLDPLWAPLRADPRFQRRLLASP